MKYFIIVNGYLGESSLKKLSRIFGKLLKSNTIMLLEVPVEIKNKNHL